MSEHLSEHEQDPVLGFKDFVEDHCYRISTEYGGANDRIGLWEVVDANEVRPLKTVLFEKIEYSDPDSDEPDFEYMYTLDPEEAQPYRVILRHGTFTCGYGDEAYASRHNSLEDAQASISRLQIYVKHGQLVADEPANTVDS